MPSSDLSASAAPPSVNPNLKTVHGELLALARELDVAVGRAKTSTQVIALLDELTEVNARVVTVGRQLFTQQTEKIRKAAENVTAATADARRAIRQLDDVKAFIQGITRFLSLVDKLVDTAKLVI